jgi:eukaryotic-like serine/threonine-protein kinase
MSEDSEPPVGFLSLLLDGKSGEQAGGAALTLERLRALLELPAGDLTTSTTAVLGRVGDRYDLTGELGRGGVGRVCLAVDRELGRQVAVKILLDPDTASRARVERFVEEARITAQLDHPAVVPVYEVGLTDSGDLYYTMKRVDGTPLSRILAGLRRLEPRLVDAFPSARLLSVFVSVCQAVAFAHDRGVVHGDIKPDNVMVGAYGEVLLLDWGFATRIGIDDLASLRRRLGAEGKDRPVAVFGTPGYLPPERITGGGPPAPVSDVYALGVILYEILTLQRPFRARTREAMLAAAVEGDPVPPPERAPGRRIAEDLGDLCMDCLARDPRRRPASASELAEAVIAYLSGSHRRTECEGRVKQGHRALERYLRVRDHLRRAEELTLEIGKRIPAWLPVADKGPLLKGLQRVEQLRQSTSDAYAEAVTSFDSALSLDARDADARAGMADAYWLRFEEAEERGDSREMALARRWLMTYDDGRYLVRIQGQAALTIDSRPTHAEVICLRYNRRDMLQHAEPYQELVRTPLRLLPLAMGSYLLIFRAPGHRSTRFPVQIRRREHFNPAEPVRLLPLDVGLERFVHVPAGRFRCGGDPESPGAQPAREEQLDDFLIGRFPVTAGEYLAFLGELQRRDPERARERAPRQTGMPGSLWELDGDGWRLPSVDRNGNRWAPDHPVYGVSWHDAFAYCEWRSGIEGVDFDLPSELQWEKAMRGVDARYHPWGDWFDPSLCSMRESHPVRPLNRPVGLFPADCSPFGVHEGAGGVQEWCRDRSNEDPGLRRQRGGAWILDKRYCRLANRRANFAWTAELSSGFRVVRPMPGDVTAPA